MGKQNSRLQEMSLECVLTDAEKLALSKEMAEHVSSKARAEDELKSYQSSMKATIQSHLEKINLIADKLNTGREHRPVQVQILEDYDDKVAVWTRLDTGEVFKKEPLPPGQIGF